MASCSKAPDHDEAFYNAVIARADSLFRADKRFVALHYIDSVHAANPSIAAINLIHLYRKKSGIYYFSGHFDSNGIYIDSILYVLEHNNLTKKYAKEYAAVLTGKGTHYFADNDLSKAFEYFYHSRVVAQSINDSSILAEQSYHLGMVFYRQEKYYDAADFFRQAFIYYNSSPNWGYAFNRKQEILNNIALSYTHMGQYDSAIAYYHDGLAFIADGDEKHNVGKLAKLATAVIYGNLAKIYTARGQDDTAIALMRRSIAINLVRGWDWGDAMLTQMQLAELYFKKNNMPEVLDLLTRLKKEQDSLYNNTGIRWARLMYQYQQRAGNMPLALQYIQQYLALKDSAEISEKKQNHTDFAQLIKTQEATYQVNLLQKDNQLSHLYLLITIALSAMAVALIALIYIYYRKSRRNVQNLIVLNTRITEQKEQLETTTAQLRQTNRDKDRILQVVAHDLRNPMSGIIMLSHTLQADCSDKDKLELLEMITGASQSALALANELLEYRDDEPESTQKEMADINELVKITTGLLRYKAGEKQQQLILHLGNAPLPALVERDRINRVLGNLIANAIKFSPGQAAIHISAGRQGNNVVIEVKDNGIGVPADMQEVIFDSFTEAKRPGTAGERSFGLGLSICRQIIKENGGTIWVQSEEGKGSSFFITLPLFKDAA